MRIQLKALTLLFVAAIALSAMVARAGDSMDELQARFKGRFEQVQKLKTAGTLGETYLGYLDAPAEIDEAAARLKDEENADRKKLYALIAEEEETTAEKVAERNAVRNFQKAQRGEFLKGPDEVWKKKA